MVRAALTGGIATGKSTVLNVFRREGVPTIDADVLAHLALAPGTPGAMAVAARFGARVVGSDGVINRSALGAVVFGDADARRDLEAIVHPEVYRAIAQWLDERPAGTPLAVADIPLLFETGRDRDFDAVIVAACSPDEQLQRLMARDGLSEADARARIDAQWPLQEKIEHAGFVVWTSGPARETETQVSALIQKLLVPQRNP